MGSKAILTSLWYAVNVYDCFTFVLIQNIFWHMTSQNLCLKLLKKFINVLIQAIQLIPIKIIILTVVKRIIFNKITNHCNKNLLFK